MTTVTITPDAARQIVLQGFVASGMPEHLARPAAHALVLAEQEGLPSHGLARVPFYAAQMRAGKVVAKAEPIQHRRGGDPRRCKFRARLRRD